MIPPIPIATRQKRDDRIKGNQNPYADGRLVILIIKVTNRIVKINHKILSYFVFIKLVPKV